MKKKDARYLARGNRSNVIVIGGITTILFLSAWVLISEFGLIEERFLPSPFRVVKRFFDTKPHIGHHLFASLQILIVGYGLGTATAFLISIVLRTSFIARSMFEPLIESLRPVPPVAIVPFFILWFGFSMGGKIFLVAIGVVLVLVPPIVNGLDNTPPTLLKTIKAFGGSNLKFVVTAALPSSIPGLKGSLRVAMATGLMLTILSEFMGAQLGLGYLINNAFRTFSTSALMMTIILAGLIGAVLDYVLVRGFSYLIRWQEPAQTQ